MGTLSLFRSLYTANDNVERKSVFDNNYVANLIGGKEFQVGKPAKNKVFFVNTKIALIGGKRYSPIDLDASIAAGDEVTNELEPFSKKSDDVFRLDLSVGIRRNRKHTTTEFKIDVQNKVFGSGSDKKKRNTINPSGISIHPVSGDLYIIDGRNPQLLIIDAGGNIKKLYTLNSKEFAQPEGITFNTAGDLFIANEGTKQPGNIVQVKIDP